MSCNYCRLPEPVEQFDILAKMSELQTQGINVSIQTTKINGSMPAFQIRMFKSGAEIMRYVYPYKLPFLESIIDSMYNDLIKGATNEL